jgi:uncharacterized protein YoxC
VTDPLFWLVLSLLFVTASLTIMLVVAIPALRELARAARSAEKLFDTLRREFPPTLEAIRLTGMEITDLTDDVSEGVQSAGNVVKQVDESLSNVRKQAQKVQSGTRSLFTGVKVAWRTFTRSPKPVSQRRPMDRLPPPRPEREFEPAETTERYPLEETNYSPATEPQRTPNRRSPVESKDETVEPRESLDAHSSYGHDRQNGSTVTPIGGDSSERPRPSESLKRINAPVNATRREQPPGRQQPDGRSEDVPPNL